MQLHPGFDFAAATEIVDYLAALGVSHLYCSPYLQAAPGSTHGYDVVDPTRVNDELGGVAGRDRLWMSLRQHGMEQLLDVVPNHMAMTRDNPWWWDVLEYGVASRYAAYFDVDWAAPESGERDRVLLPVLGDHYGKVLEAGELQLHRERAVFILRYDARRFPIALTSLHELLQRAATDSRSEALGSIAAELRHLADHEARPPRFSRTVDIVRERLASLLRESQPAAAAVDQCLAHTNDDADALDALLERQHYRLAFWRTAGQELGYRRFFDINTLIGVRVEDEQVFRDRHALLLDWLTAGQVDGVRIDHPDGLRDPEGYLHRLRSADPALWILVEKILEPGESLRPEWPVSGTTGYDFLNQVGGLFIDPRGEETFTQLYVEFTGETADYPALLYEKKHQILRDLLGSDVNRLTALLYAICSRHRRYRDYTREELHRAISEIVACFPVYRTYVRADTDCVRDQDLREVTEAIQAATAHCGELDPELFQFLGDLLLLRCRGELEDEFAMRFQQLTGPAMAKGAEDTAFYCYHRFAALNEVGGSPVRFGVSIESFHGWAAAMQQHWPETLLGTSTHDTKRSEDVRARLAVLSEMPESWRSAVRRWARHNERHRHAGWPDRNTEYLFYQTLVGAWPIDRARLSAYMKKAVKEAKVHTSWLRPNDTYERALQHFVEAVSSDTAFMADVEDFVAPLVAPGRLNSLAQTAIKLTAPGVPDVYQGTELWDLSLVDPDNRRPVDYGTRRRLLAEVPGLSPEAVFERANEGLPKLWLIHHGLRIRRAHPAAFGPHADYRPLAVHGSRADHAVAFARGNASAVTVVPRLVLGLRGDWQTTEVALPAGQWYHELTGETLTGGHVRLAHLLARCPVALLTRSEEGAGGG